MATRTMRFCGHPGCSALVEVGRYCKNHEGTYEQEQNEARKRQDHQRPSARARGYTTRWNHYSKWFLKQPGNQFCALHLDGGCAKVAQCVDHIKPHNGADDPLFWDRSNHQAACIHCNSVKGRRVQRGGYVFGVQM